MTRLNRRAILGSAASLGPTFLLGCLGDDPDGETDDQSENETDDESDDGDGYEPQFDVPDGWAILTDDPDVPNGAWTWFTDERAIVDPDVEGGPRLLVGSVAAGAQHGGDINLTWWDLEDDTRGQYTLHEELEQDDHNNPALMIRPDGRYLAMYAKHNEDAFLHYRISAEPHDPSEWRERQRADEYSAATYANLYRLPEDRDGEGRTYCFTRMINWDPTIYMSTDAGDTWDIGGRVISRSSGGSRPYPRYASDGDAIHLITTEEHPNRWQNGIYHGFIRDGSLYDSAGELLSDQLFEQYTTMPLPTDLTQVYQPGEIYDDVEMGRAWTVDLTVTDGDPVAIFSARAEDEHTDHRFFYARREDDEWVVDQLARAGGGLYGGEVDYTGLAAVDPSRPERVVISTPIDPDDGTEYDNHQLFGGETDDGGSSWSWQHFTPGTTADNLRPFIPDWEGPHTALVWFSGTYSSWTSWDTEVVAAIDPFEQGLAFDGP